MTATENLSRKLENQLLSTDERKALLTGMELVVHRLIAGQRKDKERAARVWKTDNEMVHVCHAIFVQNAVVLLGRMMGEEESDEPYHLLALLAREFYLDPGSNPVAFVKTDKEKDLLRADTGAEPENQAVQAEIADAWFSTAAALEALGAIPDGFGIAFAKSTQVAFVAYNRILRGDACDPDTVGELTLPGGAVVNKSPTVAGNNTAH